MIESDHTYLGLDLGTSGLRALLVNAQGIPIASAHSDYPVSNPHAGWSEQDPNHWTIACKIAIAELATNFPNECTNLQTIGVAGHMHGAVFLNERGTVLRPCILWNDTRSQTEATHLDGQPIFRNISGNIVFSGFTAPKLAWVRKHEPEVFCQIDKVLLPKDYLNFWLTDCIATEMSDASGTSWLDVKKRNWSSELLQKSDATHSMMPELFEGMHVIGTLSTKCQHELKLPKSVKIVAGAADNAAAACGIGAITDGHGFVSLGTSGVVLASQSRCLPAPDTAVHTFCHAIPDRWYQMGVILSATDCLNWLATTLQATPEQLAALMPDDLRPPSSTVFLPYLAYRMHTIIFTLPKSSLCFCFWF